MASRGMATLAAAFLVAGAAGTAAAQHPCAGVVEAEIAAAGIAAEDVTGINFARQTQTIRGDENRIIGYNAWVSLASCPGTFIVDLDRNCRVRQVYTRGMCTLPGVKSFQD